MTKQYAPRSHAKFHRWAFVFTGRIAQDPAAANVSRAVSDELSAAFTSYSEAYQLTRSARTRTPAAVSDRAEKRKALESLCRMYAQRIRHDREVSDHVKCGLHIVHRNRRRKRTPPPNSHPALQLKAMHSGRHVLRWSDDSVPWANRKPKDAAGLQLFACVAERAVGDPARMKYLGTYTKQRMNVDWPVETAGLIVTYLARWISAKGEEGPWSHPLPVQVAFAGAGLMGGLMGVDRASQAAMMHEYRRAA
jgi:hypothetical protein